MDSKKKRKLRRSGSPEGARIILESIYHTMGTALKNNEPIRSRVQTYLSSLPTKEFETLMSNLDSMYLNKSVLEDIEEEAKNRAEQELLK